jgi:DNA-binding transcriptional regulator YdaS (Cro superfamily)
MGAMDHKPALERACEIVGSPTKLAAALNVSLQVLGNWKERGIPIERCVAVENATGGKVTRRELRPHDWRSIWPELEEA